MNHSGLRNNYLKFKTLGELPIVFEESMEYTLRISPDIVSRSIYMFNLRADALTKV